jgi:hypothetical protein
MGKIYRVMSAEEQAKYQQALSEIRKIAAENIPAAFDDVKFPPSHIVDFIEIRRIIDSLQ